MRRQVGAQLVEALTLVLFYVVLCACGWVNDNFLTGELPDVAEDAQP